MLIQNVATVYIFHPDGRRVLLLEHYKGNLKGKWLPPGGHCEEGETPDATALREAQEETNQVIRLRDGLAENSLNDPVKSSGSILKQLTLPLVLSEEARRLPQPFCLQLERITGVPEGEHCHLDFVYLADPVEERPLLSEKGRPLAWIGRGEMEALPLLEDVRRVLERILP